MDATSSPSTTTHDGELTKKDGIPQGDGRRQIWKLGIALAKPRVSLVALGISGTLLWASSQSRAFAQQVLPDATLGAETTQVTPSGNTFFINGGATRGTLLFHSFQEFSVPTGGTAFFQNAPAIQNIISRVTGTSISNIDGIIQANGTANLFLINPNGINFGANAQLNLGGSFFASTANSVTFADGTQFSATNPQPAPLLTVSVPLGLQYGGNNGNISVTGSNLEVPDGQTLALVGGNVDVNGGVLRAQGGRIELGGLTAFGTVTIEPTTSGNNLRLDFPDAVARGNVTLSNESIVDVVANGGGDIVINAGNISITGDSFVCAGLGASPNCETPSTTFAASDQAGNILFDATGTVTLTQSRIENNVSEGASGNSGDIFDAVLNRNNLFGSIIIRAGSINLTNGAQISTSTFGNGSAGLVFLQAEGEVNMDNSSIFSQVAKTAVGDAGGILIEAGSISATNSDITSSTFGQGNAGGIFLEADESIKFFKSRVFNNVESGGVGDGGLVEITAESLTLDGSQIQTIVRDPDMDDGTPAGMGNAGKIDITVDEALLTGVTDQGNPSLISSSSLGNGDAGLVILRASSDVTFDGDGAGLRSSVEGQGVGDAGGVGVRARSLNLRNGAFISVNNLSPSGQAGAILIQARDIFMFENDAIAAVTLSGNGGDIELDLEDFLVLRRQSDVSTTAGFAPGGGDGGNMKINAGYIFGLPVNDNNVTAQAYQGKGGSIRINSNRLYKIDLRDDDFLNTNDITVSSTYGINGQTELNTVDIDPTQGLTSLTETLIDPSSLITPRCAVRDKDTDEEVNKFTATGRGGIPPSPNDPLQNDSVETNWVTTDPPTPNGAGDDSSINPEQSVPPVNSVPKTPALVEAQGWVYGSNGEVILTAQAPTVTPQRPSLTPANLCNGY